MATDYVRKPFTGSCHCGTIKYIAYLTLPSPAPAPGTKLDLKTFEEKSGLRIYKCNCTACHKMGIFHLRLRLAPDDFMVLSPVDPKTPDDEGSGVSTYLCNARRAKWYFCTTCGVRTFTIRGEKEVGEVELPKKLLGKEGEGMEKVKVWKLKKDGWTEKQPGATGYLSVNMTSLDALQEGLDLRAIQDWGVVEYGDGLHMTRAFQETPHEGGMY